VSYTRSPLPVKQDFDPHKNLHIFKKKWIFARKIYLTEINKLIIRRLKPCAMLCFVADYTLSKFRRSVSRYIHRAFCYNQEFIDPNLHTTIIFIISYSLHMFRLVTWHHQGSKHVNTDYASILKIWYDKNNCSAYIGSINSWFEGSCYFYLHLLAVHVSNTTPTTRKIGNYFPVDTV
jgi:hypothetical protein